jgi:hypothetical protein
MVRAPRKISTHYVYVNYRVNWLKDEGIKNINKSGQAS